ncbi:hypothetical protein CDL15_Pgr019890 [Punica granatum]|uniref:Bromo domain-containing protein n=1 Tax=Punica granatum TaxID=22663 RepID=A0A218W554_PUNGR|nr:hypothetical protein CDL15_Pgr019890 [Punica granatum]
MYSKQPTQGDTSVLGPVRTSDRLKRRPKIYGRTYLYYGPSLLRTTKSKTKTRTAASQIAKIFRPGSRPQRNENTSSMATNLRRSSRRRIRVKYAGYTSSSEGGDGDIMIKLRPSRERTRNNSLDELSTPKRRKLMESRSVPRREGLRPRHSSSIARGQPNLHSDDEDADEQGTSDDKAGQDETENGNGGDDAQNDGEDDLKAEDDGEDEGEEDGDDEEGEDEQEGRRRYDLRNRAEVRRLSMDTGKQRVRSPRRVLHQGMGNKVSRDVRKGGSRVHKRHRIGRNEDSDDSLLVDELDQGPAIPWGRSGGRSGPPWLLGGLDMHGSAAWGLNIAASGWGHQADGFATLSSGIQTAGPSSKGGADIQPLQVDDNISFDDIGGLSEYIDALKEMVFFPLLYPDFFASYHITPPRGVLLCGPPGTGKTLIARALACAASKAGQKVSFYMRKGADVLSKWVGEAERQLKLLFEEAQRNQPSIIFFDEIDGLAPVRSSKQEQIHNSIVSTLLALMDGLDSRGQVVLIGATNRIDAIDGALRRPGRFDREFNFPLPGCEARAEILDIHSRKWKMPPSKELRLELAASCVGYCGADLKALCTEAAIRAFRERYPQVYTSDDKFLIDVDSVKVEKYHFVEAMSTITPAAHRGSIVHSRPLSSVVVPCLKRHLEKVMTSISDIFPPLSAPSELTQLSMLSYGSSFSLVYRPRLLLYGSEGVGLDHLGPAVLHELEKFPVYSLGLPSLLSDPSAKTPEEALVHIFGEARRTTPSVLYLPQFHLWWETAHEQLRAVLITLLEELPSDLPILLLGVSQAAPNEVDTDGTLIFPPCSIYQVGTPSTEDRELFFDHLIGAALSVSSEVKKKDSSSSVCVTELPKAPKVAAGPKASELKAKFESEQHALRRLRMCLRDVCNRILYDKRFRDFHYPVMDEDAPNYRSIIQNPMDMSTLLQRVDSGQFITCSAFLQDIDLIVANAKAYNGDDYNGTRIVSRAHELRDSVHGMISQMDPALLTFCDKIAAQGGPLQLPDDLAASTFPSIPVVQLGTVTRASARLRNVQPQLNLDQSNDVLKRPKKNADFAYGGSTADDNLRTQDSLTPKPPNEEEVNDALNTERQEPSPAESNPEEPPEGGTPDCADGGRNSPHASVMDIDVSGQVESIKRLFVERTDNYVIPQLERLYTRVIKGVFETRKEGKDDLKQRILSFLSKFAEDEASF